MRGIAFVVALFLVVGMLAHSAGAALPPSPPVGETVMSQGMEKYVPGLEARSKYTGCRMDYQIGLLEGLAALSPENAEALQTASAGLQQGKEDAANAALFGNVEQYNSYMKENLTLQMTYAANLTRSVRRGFAAGNGPANVSAIYAPAKKEMLSCQEAAREHVQELKKMEMRERVQAAKEKLQARVQAAKEKAEEARERVQERLDRMNQSQGKQVENENWGETNGNSSGKGNENNNSQGKN